jgi:hypothetical protein
LGEYLENTADLMAPVVVGGPWSFWLDIGRPAGSDIVTAADLDNYALPLAKRMFRPDLVSVWCTKRHAETSRVVVASANEVSAPGSTSSDARLPRPRPLYKEQVRAMVVGAAAVRGEGVHLQIAFVVGAGRN